MYFLWLMVAEFPHYPFGANAIQHSRSVAQVGYTET